MVKLRYILRKCEEVKNLNPHFSLYFDELSEYFKSQLITGGQYQSARSKISDNRYFNNFSADTRNQNFGPADARPSFD